jgi:hypothetical protein
MQTGLTRRITEKERETERKVNEWKKKQRKKKATCLTIERYMVGGAEASGRKMDGWENSEHAQGCLKVPGCSTWSEGVDHILILRPGSILDQNSNG